MQALSTRKDTMQVPEQQPHDGPAAPDLFAPVVATERALIGRLSDAVALIGFLGSSPLEGYVRLYESLALTHWLEIPRTDLVDRSSAAGDPDPTVGESIIWVNRDALLTLCESVRASYFESGGRDTFSRHWPKP
jgi:hypothetical protein